jgi:hypothetical protein
MKATIERPYRHRQETLRESNLRMEFSVLRGDVSNACERLERVFKALEPAAVEIGPPAYQLVLGGRYEVDKLRRRAGR